MPRFAHIFDRRWKRRTSIKKKLMDWRATCNKIEWPVTPNSSEPPYTGDIIRMHKKKMALGSSMAMKAALLQGPLDPVIIYGMTLCERLDVRPS